MENHQIYALKVDNHVGTTEKRGKLSFSFLFMQLSSRVFTKRFALKLDFPKVQNTFNKETTKHLQQFLMISIRSYFKVSGVDHTPLFVGSPINPKV